MPSHMGAFVAPSAALHGASAGRRVAVASRVRARQAAPAAGARRAITAAASDDNGGSGGGGGDGTGSGGGVDGAAAPPVAAAPVVAPPAAAEAAAEAALYDTPSVGEMGYVEKTDATAGALDDIDRSNYTFGSLNALDPERDLLYGKRVAVANPDEEGKTLEVYYRELGEPTAPVVLMLHGLPSSSFQFREVMPLVAAAGYRAIAPDWVGFGLSDKPQPGYGFKYTTASYTAVLSSVLKALNVASATVLVQGWLGASHGLPFALRTLLPAGALRGLFILNSPLPPSVPSLPLSARLWRLPGMLGDIFTQDAMSVERVLEKGGPYFLSLPDANTYRRPMMLSGDAGFALGGAVRACPLDLNADGVADDLRAWTEEGGGNVEVAWGVKDKYLGRDVAERFGAELCPSAKVGFVEGAGHYTAEDFGERVGERLVQFLRRTDPV
ncbi:hypothetical protein MMPV_007891 [Pyropia vietnamensis]